MLRTMLIMSGPGLGQDGGVPQGTPIQSAVVDALIGVIHAPGSTDDQLYDAAWALLDASARKQLTAVQLRRVRDATKARLDGWVSPSAATQVQLLYTFEHTAWTYGADLGDQLAFLEAFQAESSGAVKREAANAVQRWKTRLARQASGDPVPEPDVLDARDTVGAGAPWWMWALGVAAVGGTVAGVAYLVRD